MQEIDSKVIVRQRRYLKCSRLVHKITHVLLFPLARPLVGLPTAPLAAEASELIDTLPGRGALEPEELLDLSGID